MFDVVPSIIILDVSNADVAAMLSLKLDLFLFSYINVYV